MSEYNITLTMVGVIREISDLNGENPPCHKNFVCTGVACGIIQMSRKFLEELNSLEEDYSGYGDQMINLAVSVYRSSLEGKKKDICTVSGMYKKLLSLGELAYPQFEKRDQE